MKKEIKNCFVSLCSFMALGFDIYALYNRDYEALLSLGILGSAFLLLVFIILYSKIKFHKNKIIYILSAIFTFFMIFGNSYLHLGNALLVFENFWFFLLSVVMAIGYWQLFACLLSILFTFLDNGKFRDKASKKCGKIQKLFSDHPFLFSFIFIIVCWLPYIVSFYPIILSPDPSFQIKQFFGIRTKYADYAVLLDENVVITNHHPVFHTVLLGGCLKLGHVLGNDNFGLFCYSFLQIIVLAVVFSLTLFMMKKMKLSTKFRWVILLLYSLVPLFPLYAMSGVKDVLFSAVTLLYIMLIYYLLKTKLKSCTLRHYVGMVILMLLVILLRNNGLHMIVLSFPFVIWALKPNWKPLLAVFASVLILSSCYSKVLLPALKITPGSIREMLSVPFQQTARYVKYHEGEVTVAEKEIIDKILGYDTLASRYNPELADPVKNEFNKYATNEDLKEYFCIWFQGLLKQPVTYIDATINNVYGFFYPEKTSWYVYYKYDTRITQDGFDYHYNSLGGVRDVLSSFAVGFPQIPVLGIFSNISFSVWLVFILTGYCIYRKWYDILCIMVPSLILILVCVVGPANTYFRYALPFVFALPFMISCVLERCKDNSIN